MVSFNTKTMSCSMKKPLRVFLAVAEFTDILPHKNYGKKNNKALLMQVKSIITLLLILILNIQILQHRIVNVHPQLNSVYVTVDILRTVNILLAILSFFVDSIFKNKRWMKLFKITHQLESSTQSKNTTFLLLSLIYVGICDFALIGIFLVEFLDFYDSTFYAKLILRITHIICFYYENSSAVTISIFAYAIENKLQQMQEIFKSLRKHQLYSMTQIKQAKRLYLTVTEITSLINNFFGIKILLCFINEATSLLWLLITIVQIWNPAKFEKNLELDRPQFIITVVFGLIGMIPSYIITMSYARVSSKLDYILMNCYQLEDKFSHESYEHKEIEALWKFISENRLRFTAVNFFNIEPWVLLGIIASSTTYFIALIQFN